MSESETWAELSARVKTWIVGDPDPTSRDELEGLLAQGESAATELRDRFQGPLAFGTAGLRGLLGAGENRMNRAVVIRTSRGLADYLLAEEQELAKSKGVVVGYDGRRLSTVLAEDTAAVLLARGIPVRLCETVCPTPVLAYAVKDFEAAAGVMVTASHNPPQYNGYKVYAKNGAQIIPPMDDGIAAKIDAAPAATEIERADLAQARERGALSSFGQELEARYLKQVAALSVTTGGDRSFPVAYTALHGVGGRLMGEALAWAGFTNFHPVAEQQEPDGEFPTVAFPNPEEDGALDLVLQLARAKGAPLVLANDPDADRLAAAVLHDGDYVQLTGNELGALLGHYLLSSGPSDGERVVMTTIVSSPLLSRIAAGFGARFEETLTGFKWIATKGLELKQEGVRFVFGYEEALGYTVGELVQDKDGISAAVALCELNARLGEQNQTLIDRLEEIARQFGLFLSTQRSVKFEGLGGQAKMAAVMDQLRNNPLSEVGGLTVVERRDYQTLERVREGQTSELQLHPSNVLAYDLADGSRVIARPSGTEPKLKLYVDVREEMQPGESFAAARERATKKMEELKAAFAAAAGVS